MNDDNLKRRQNSLRLKTELKTKRTKAKYKYDINKYGGSVAYGLLGSF